jgi:hypothetical protein
MPTLLADRKFSTCVVATTAESFSWKAKVEVKCPHCHRTHELSVQRTHLDFALPDAVERLRECVYPVDRHTPTKNQNRLSETGAAQMNDPAHIGDGRGRGGATTLMVLAGMDSIAHLYWIGDACGAIDSHCGFWVTICGTSPLR